MTSKSLNGGPNSAPAVDPTTNRLTSGYDANGNMLTGYGLTMTYDERNRVASATPTYSGTEYYGYAPDNKRIYRWNPTTGTEEWTFYGARGERIGAFALNTGGTYYFSATQTNMWFAGQLISGANGFVFRDRVGSNRETGARYYPYGDEITSTSNGTEKYGTYVRDSFTALDYADQRYYASSYGRFNTADPLAASAKSNNPGSWNRYNYTLGDPVNNNDPSGMNLPFCGGIVNGFDGDEYDGCDGFGGTPVLNYATICDTNPGWALENPGDCGGDIIGSYMIPEQTQAPTPKCWQNIGNINQTLVDLGANILEIAETKANITNATEISSLTQDIASTIQSEDQQDLLALNAPPSFYVGGHFNLDLNTLTLQSLFSASDYSAFQSAFGGSIDGTRQSAVYGNAAQGNYTLHSKQSGGYYDVHFDRYNPLSNVPIGTIQHLFGDVIGGHIGTPCLDPAWQ